MFYVISVRYIYSKVWFQCKTSEGLVSLKFLSMSCMVSFCNGQVLVESEITTSRDCLVQFVLYSSKTPYLFHMVIHTVPYIHSL